MAKKHETGMAYNMKKLHKVFAFLSIFFLLTVIWVFLDDYLRPWKAVQVEARKIEQRKLQEEIQQEAEEIDQEKLRTLQKQLDEAEEKVAQRKDQIKKVQQKLKKARRDKNDERIRNGVLNSEVSALTYKYNKANANNAPNADELQEKLESVQEEFAESNNQQKIIDQRISDLQSRLAHLKREKIKVEDTIEDMTKRKSLLRKAKEKTAFDAIFAFRNAPFVDFLDPTLKIQQIVTEKALDDRYFQKVPKVDRCITCHTFINEPGYEDQPNPHKTHPDLDLMVGKESHHPMNDFGCTTCHGGEGHRVNSFKAVAHTPSNEEEKKEWMKKYDWEPPHKVPMPMRKLKHTEASCLKCHDNVEYVPQADKLNAGRRKMEEYGCYGCHKIEGWEHKKTPGPSLKKVASKIDKQFFRNWVWEPRSFSEHARMPQFFNQSNNSKPQYKQKNIAEVNAMAEYIFKISEEYEPFMAYRGGNEERGKKLIKEVGCLGCHGVEGFEEESKKIDAYAGPYLANTGSKVDPDWLVSWLKKPSHYQESTIMPSFRLSDQETQDIAAYLLSLKNESFEELEFADMNKNARDEILLTYFSAFDTMQAAEKKLKAMSDRERTLELGKRSIGKYGCYSCHNIDGFEDRAPIGPELTEEGSKPLHQFNFGHTDVDHSRDAWIKAQLLNPRRWDEGTDTAFKDLLRMPNFHLTKKEAESITLAVLAQVDTYVPPEGKDQLTANEKIAEKGMRLVNKFNCVGCHQVDGERGDILKIYEDVNQGPPRLVEEGHRVQSEWFHYFLDNVYPIRPWLDVRMPSFNLTDEEINTIVSGFQAKAGVRTFVDLDEKLNWKPGEREAAKKLFEEMACTSCHSQGFDNNIEPQAPDFHYVKRRLRPSWVKKWLKDPQAILPGTTMPNFWFDGQSTVPGVLDGDMEKQIDALTKYIYEMSYDAYSPEHRREKNEN